MRMEVVDVDVVGDDCESYEDPNLWKGWVNLSVFKELWNRTCRKGQGERESVSFERSMTGSCSQC